MRLLAIGIATLTLLAGPAAAGKEPPAPWTPYGAPITLRKASRLDRVVPRSVGKEVLVQGTIADVCQNKGCWMTIRDGAREVRVEFKDYGFFVPWSAAGKPVRLQGVLTERVLSPEHQAHVAAESKEGGGIGAPAAEPKKVLVFVASGAAIQGGGEITAEQRRKIGGVADSHDHDHSAPGHKH